VRALMIATSAADAGRALRIRAQPMVAGARGDILRPAP
jgi:hypothetical protein